MKIKECHLECTAEHTLLSTVIGGQELWYRFPPSYKVERPGDALLAAALFPAMLLGEPLEIAPTLPVSPRFLKGLETIQSVFSFWYPMLRKIEIQARVEEGRQADAGVAVFFSGGVDSAYTLLTRAAEITHLIFVRGVENMSLTDDAMFQKALRSNQRIAERHKMTLVLVESNVKLFGYAFKPLEWSEHECGGLSSIALAMGFRKAFIASSNTYADLLPTGSHPLTDGMWSSDTTEIVHDGADASRSDKLRRIVQDQPLLESLRVCWYWQASGSNCGRCEKCLRTMATLRALRVSTPALPRLDSVDRIARLPIARPINLPVFEDNLQLARAAGDWPLARALSRCILRYHTRRWLVEVDRLMFSGRLKRLWRSVRPDE